MITASYIDNKVAINLSTKLKIYITQKCALHIIPHIAKTILQESFAKIKSFSYCFQVNMVSYVSTGGHVCAMWHVVHYTRGGSKLQNGCLEASTAELSYRLIL